MLHRIGDSARCVTSACDYLHVLGGVDTYFLALLCRARALKPATSSEHPCCASSRTQAPPSLADSSFRFLAFYCFYQWKSRVSDARSSRTIIPEVEPGNCRRREGCFSWWRLSTRQPSDSRGRALLHPTACRAHQVFICAGDEETLHYVV